MAATGDHQILHCRWNWCARTFELPTDLLNHLKSEHFSHILRVEKKELDIYLRCNEGRSGMTDSLFPGLQTQPADSSQVSNIDESQAHAEPMPDERMPRAMSSRPSVQPSPLQDGATQDRRTPTHSSQSSHSNQPPTALPVANNSANPPSQASAPPPSASTRITPPNPSPNPRRPHPRSHSFADCDAASSPLTTPLASPLPPTPPLHARIADAINAAASRAPPLPLPRRPSSRFPLSPAPRGHSPLGSQPPLTPLPLPRRATRTSRPNSKSTSQPQSQPQPQLRRDGPRPHARTGPANVSTDSAASARDVETQLTAGVTSATPSPPVARVEAQRAEESPMSMDVEGVEASGSRLPSLSYPEDPYPPLRTQAAYDSQLEVSRADLEESPAAPTTSQAPHGHPPAMPVAPSTQTERPQSRFTMQFSSGRLALRMESEPPEGNSDAMPVDRDVEPGSSAPMQTEAFDSNSSFQLQTQAFYPSQ